MFVGCQWVFTTFVRFWKVLWVWSGFLGKVLEGMLVRVWEETIADTIVGKCSWVCSGSRFYLCSVVWGARQGVWSGFLGRFMGDMIRRAWEENHCRPSTQRNCCRILEFGSWILDLGVLSLDLGVLILGVWILEFLDFLRSFLEGFMGLKWFPWEGSGGDAWESLRGNHCRPSSPGNDLVFVRCFLGRFMGLKWLVWRVPEGILVRVWEETIADTIVGKCSWVCSGSRFYLCSVVWGGIKGSEVVSLWGLWEIWSG